jgi:hydroxymethylglutaryl-CoA lyase
MATARMAQKMVGHEVTSAVLKAGRCEDLSKEMAKEQHNR